MQKYELDWLSTCTVCQWEHWLPAKAATGFGSYNTQVQVPWCFNLQLQPSQPVSIGAGHRSHPVTCTVVWPPCLALGLWLRLPLGGCCRVWELSWFHSYQCVRKVTQSSRIQSFMLHMECAVFLQECTSEVITLSVNSGELSTSNDRAIMCWPLPKIIQQLFQLFCHPKKTLFQFQLAGF